MHNLQYKVLASNFPMSPMEKIINNYLKIRNIVFHREVAFDKCKNPKTGMVLRYDFYIPGMNILIEYDGKDFHSSEEVKYRDTLKNNFAKTHQIHLVRLRGLEMIKDFISSIIDKEEVKDIPKPKEQSFKKPKKPKQTKAEKLAQDKKVYQSRFKLGDKPKRLYFETTEAWRYARKVWEEKRKK